MVPVTAARDINVVHTAYRTAQEVAKFLRMSEDDTDLIIFYADLTAYCAIIRDHWNRISKSAVGINRQLYTRLLDQLDRIVVPSVFGAFQAPSSSKAAGARINAFSHHWNEARKQNDSMVQLGVIRSCLDFGATPEQRNQLIESFAVSEEEIRKLYPEDPSEWAVDDFAPTRKISEPPYAAWKAAQSIFKALTACKGCPCSPAHDFSARICLGTYRKPDLGPEVIEGNELDFDLFLSMMEGWHEARVRTARETVVQFAVDDQAGSCVSSRRDTALRPMKVKRLCEPIARIKTMAAYRLDFKVMRGQLFKLQSKRSTSLFDTTKNSISLEQILEGGSRSFSERARRILAVLLSSATLHLLDTSWLRPMWNSANVLFFRTAAEAIPLRPFIQIQLADLERELYLGQPSAGGAPGSYNDETGSDSFDPDDIDPDDLMQHQCPALISLAAMLMEVYFVSPFNILARRYGVELGQDVGFHNCTRYIDTTLVFEACRGEIPENSLFLYAIEKCLDPTIWEDPGGDKLDDQVLRTRIYEEVVQPLETELSQAYSDIPIDELDSFAQNLDFASWDQVIQPWADQMRSETPRGRFQDLTRTSSPSSRLSASYHLENRLTVQPSFQSRPQFPEPSDRGPSSVSYHYHSNTSIPMALPSKAHGDFKFFDDETTSEAHTQAACLEYSQWKSKYLEVYEKFIPAQLSDSCSAPVKIAILDTGIDLTHPEVEARIENIKERYNWLHDRHRRSVHDRNGHGTFTASLLLDYAPDAELYIAKIAENKPSSPRTIAEAINHAVSEWKVDIISMSFGFPTGNIAHYDELERALANANAKGVLLFAAASNSGGRLGRSFPACEPAVIAVHSTDANGNRSAFSPTATDDDISIATIGEAVESAWPVHLCEEEEEAADSMYVKYKSGTSYATPIVAGVAAFLLLYARVHLPAKADALKSQKRMKAVLRKVAEKGINHTRRDGYHFVDLSLHADSIFGRGKEYIDLIINDLLSY
ncbi:pfs domain-containing protein [Xylaria palmicola]|nr:pfs domain-containing protein [Xylaria palmicola]